MRFKEGPLIKDGVTETIYIKALSDDENDRGDVVGHIWPTSQEIRIEIDALERLARHAEIVARSTTLPRAPRACSKINCCGNAGRRLTAGVPKT
jgi:hypothetical protein